MVYEASIHMEKCVWEVITTKMKCTANNELKLHAHLDNYDSLGNAALILGYKCMWKGIIQLKF